MALPVVSGRKLIKALSRVGYHVIRQRGDHVRLHCPDDSSRKPTTVPLHREIKPGTFKSILADANLTVDQLRELL